MLHQKNHPAHVVWLFPLLLALYEMAAYLSNDAYLPALPNIALDLYASHHLVQLTLTTWFMGSASMQLILGPIADRVGRRPVLLLGGIIFVAVTLGCALTQNIYSLLLLRFIQGATITSMIVAGYATVHEFFNQEQAIHTLAIMSSITIIAPSFGPLFGAIILNYADWRWIFGLLAIWAAIVIIGLYFKMPETRSEVPQKIQLKPIFIQYRNVLTNKKFMLYIVIFQCVFASMIAWIAAGPFLLIDSFGFKTMGFGIVQIFIFGTFIIGTRLVKKLMSLYSLDTIVKAGVNLAFIGGIYALVTSLLFPGNIWNMIIAMMIIAGGSSVAFPILNRLAIESSQEPMSARIVISSTAMGVAGIIGSALIGALYNGTLFSLGIIIFILSTIAAILRAINAKKPAN